MIIGTGIDIVEINRFKKIKDLKGIAKKILHSNEFEEFNKKAKDQTIFLAKKFAFKEAFVKACLLYTSPSPRDMRRSRMPSSA